MEPGDWRTLLSDPEYQWDSFGPGMSDHDLAELARWFGRPLPEDYIAFLRLSDGAAVQYDLLWDLSIHPGTQLPEIAEGYHVGAPDLPGAILFGSHAIFHLVFDTRPQHSDGRYPVLAIDWYELSSGWEKAIPVADDFRSLLLLRRPLLPEVQMTRAGMTNNHAQVAVELNCPSCGIRVSDRVLFQWGYCHWPGAFRSRMYHVGAPLEWKRCSDGSIRSWAYFAEGAYAGTIQIGDPTIKHLITRDVTQFSMDPALHPRPCQECGTILEGAAVEIQDGVVRRAWIYAPGELDKSARDFLFEPDGTVTPVPAWVEHPLETVHNC
jgi:hypothetical protein